MAISPELRASIKAQLALGRQPKEISAVIEGASYPTVLNIRKEMESDKTKERISSVAQLDPIALDLIVDKAKAEAPAAIIKKLEAVQEGLSGLQLLDNKFHTTMSLVLKKAEKFLSEEDLKPSEWVAITNALSNAYNNIFNNKGVSVNVDNSTQISSSKLSMFKGSMRG